MAGGFEMLNEGTANMEIEQELRFKVERLNSGLGYGEGTIASPPEGASVEDMSAAATAIEQSPNAIVPVDKDESGNVLDDDGCGDGRSVLTVFKGAGTVLKRSLNRAKVFGGAVAMAASDRIGLGKSLGRSLNETFDDSMQDLADKEIDFGGHTDEHEEGPNCGCGAIDKAPVVVRNIVNFKKEIKATALSLGASETGIDEVMQNFEVYADEIDGQEYAGSKVMGGIKSLGKIVKKLAGGHKEGFIVLNTIEDTTINQELIRQVTDGRVQAFGVDVWRMQQIAVRLHPQDEIMQQKSFVSQLVYTLGVAGTLTKGNLPVYLVSPAAVPAAA